MQLRKLGGGGPGAPAALARLTDYLAALERGLPPAGDGAAEGWLGGPSCRHDVFLGLFRRLLAVYASPPPLPPLADAAARLRSLGGAAPLHALLEAGLQGLEALGGGPGPGRPADLVFLVSSAAQGPDPAAS